MFSIYNPGPPDPGDGRPEVTSTREDRVLDVLWEWPWSSAKNVASRLRLDLADVSGILTGLEDAGFVSSTQLGSVNRIFQRGRSCKRRIT